jgi:hypothetical protein
VNESREVKGGKREPEPEEPASCPQRLKTSLDRYATISKTYLYSNIEEEHTYCISVL